MNKLLPIIVLVVLAAVGGYFLFFGGSKEFTGSITEVLARGKEATCTWENGAGTSGTLYVQSADRVLMVPDDLGYILVTDNCLYGWSDGGDPGAKQCFTAGEDFTQMMTVVELNLIYEGVEYRCRRESQTEDRFTVPSGVEFTDWD